LRQPNRIFDEFRCANARHRQQNQGFALRDPIAWQTLKKPKKMGQRLWRKHLKY
jgi:hypothetical protein